MLDRRITTTHVTPAMSQLITSHATVTAPSLTNAFITGDMLTKRDCAHVQKFAPNARIINMYGATETSRAVSYFVIPPHREEPTFLRRQKDVVPAGSGLGSGVQLLVVNRNDKSLLCGVGEVGEIYLRSGGMSDGYLDEKATAEKFTKNWFVPAGWNPPADTILHPKEGGGPLPAAKHWKGVRDRLYRSGDLGRYLADGTVECSGRADNMIKLRGYRVRTEYSTCQVLTRFLRLSLEKSIQFSASIR